MSPGESFMKAALELAGEAARRGEVPVGAVVTWMNCESAATEPHSSTADSGSWDSSNIITGARYSRTFGVAGVFPYHCTPHRSIGMVGKVVVR